MANSKQKLPLEGITIIDNSWVIAGPHGTRLLSDLGARVIHIETSKRRDNIRFDHLRAGVKDGFKEGGYVFQENNRDALSFSLNMKNEKGKEIYRKLVAVGDVVVSNFTPKAIRSMGIDFESLKDINPGIITVNASGLGDYGCKKDTMIFAAALNCVAGLSYTVGYEGEQGFGLAVSTADDLGGAMVAFSVLAALEARDRTGEGQFIDLSETENMMSSIGSTLLEWNYNQTQTGPTGNHAYYGEFCPHNAYPAAGFDNWIAISIGDDEEWKRFVDVVKEYAPELTDPKYSTFEGRKANECDLDRIIGMVTSKHNKLLFAEKLQNNRVSAAPVQRSSETLADEHLNERGFFQPANLPEIDPRQPDFMITADVPKTQDRTGIYFTPAASLGKDNDFILREILHLSDAEIEEAKATGAFD